MAPEYPSSFTVVDLLSTPILLLVIVFVMFRIKGNFIKSKPYYKYFVPGLMVKLFGATCICIIYLYYYEGGDTINYFYSSQVMVELITTNLKSFFSIVFLGNLTPENYSAFTEATGYPPYFSDSLSFFVVRVVTPFAFISGGSYLGTSLLIACLSYSGIWKLYQTFVDEFPALAKELAIAVLFVPSVFFWGSGILKDPLTLSALGWFVYAFHQIFIKRKFTPTFIIYLLLSSYVMLAIKPYIYYTLIPCAAIWILSSLSKKIKGGLIRTISMPLLLVIFGWAAWLIVNQAGQNKSKYSINNLLEYGVVVQQDLRSEAYNGNSFDIGSFDATLPSMLSKAPLAINAALFRPYLWEAKNSVMRLSAIENLLILGLTLYLLFKLRVIYFFRLIIKNDLLLFSFCFAMLFSFSVGLTTSNFGSLVRYKIPSIPFFVASLFILRYYYQNPAATKLKEIQ